MLRHLIWMKAVVLLFTSQLFANYTFLGKVENYQRTPAGILLHCEDDLQLQIDFFLPNMFRVTLKRPEFQEPLLEYPLAKMAWEPVALEFEEQPDQLILRSAELDLFLQKSPCRMTVKNKGGEIIQQDDPGMGTGWDGKEVRTWKQIGPDEKFFGLGEKAGDLNKRGEEWVMWNTDDYHHENYTDPLYQSIPFFVGLRNFKAYGIYLNNSYRSRFNLGAGNLRYYSFSAEAGNLDYFFIYGPEVSRVVESYTELTGRTPMPPKWALGYQQCRWSYYPDAEVVRIAQTFREKKIPADAIYLDIHYMDGYRVFTWHPERFPDAAGLTQKLSDLGFKVVVIIDPGVKVDSGYRVAQEGVRNDHFLKYPDGEIFVGAVWPGPSYFPDFSRAQTRSWWGEQFGALLDVGVDGFWNDMNEPAVWGKTFPDEVLFYDEGRISSQKKMHNLYGFLMAKACYDGVKKLRPNQRPFVITRAGFAGEQRFTTMWTGDNKASEEQLEMGIRMVLGMGVSGVAFAGTDVGGFRGSPSPELYARWLQASVFTPLFRTHTEYNSRDQEPWAFGDNVEAISRQFISLRYEMLPYLYSLFRECYETGAPIMRPLFWHAQNDPQAYDRTSQEQFFVGENLLVAPVTRVGQYAKKVYLPAGQWLDLNTEQVYEGAQAVLVEAPLDRLPMFLRAGGLIPSGEVNQYVGEKPLTQLTVDLFPTIDGPPFLFYEDDGESFDYTSGRYRLTEFGWQQGEDRFVFSKRRTHDEYRASDRKLRIRLHQVPQPPRQVQLGQASLPPIQPDGGQSGYYYDAEKHILTVQFADKGAEQKVVIVK